MANRMEIVDDDGFPEIPTELDELREEVRKLTIYVRTLSEMNRNTHSRLNNLIRSLRSRGVRDDDAD